MSDGKLPSEYLPEPGEEKPQQRKLPDIDDACSFVEKDLPEPEELVEGLLHRGSKLVLGGSSKANKTWSLVDLALSVAFGEPWLSCKTRKGRVLYINLEVQPAFFRKRLEVVARAKGIRLVPGHHGLLLLEICKEALKRGYVLIIIDPIYKVYGGLRENDAGDVAQMLDGLEKLATETGAAVAFGAHFSKGNQAAKESIDRISGSGVFARDPDSILVMTAHDKELCFVVEATLRNFPPLKPFVIRWDYPLMRRDDTLDPKQLKQAKGGRKAVYTPDRLLALLPVTGLATGDWKKLALEEIGMGRSKFFELRSDLDEDGRIEEIGGKWFPVRQSPESPETD